MFALNNSTYLAEFNRYKSMQILQMLRGVIEHFPTLSDIDSINGYIPKSITKKNIKITIDTQTYKEHSSGDFSNLSKNENLHKIFEKIRESIIRNTNNE